MSVDHGSEQTVSGQSDHKKTSTDMNTNIIQIYYYSVVSYLQLFAGAGYRWILDDN